MKNKLVFSIIGLVLVLAIIAYIGYGYYQKYTYKLERPVVSMEIENYGTIKMELYPEMAPNTVKNFIKLINEGYYNGLTFHRVEESLIQGGDTSGDGTGNSENGIKGEFSKNGYEGNTLKFERGTLGLARRDYSSYSSIDKNAVEGGYNSGYAQFFIMAQNEPNFNGYYTAFGKVIEGIEIVDEITELETTVETNEETGEQTQTTTPVNKPIIKSMTIETFGVEYKEPETQEQYDINSALMKYYYGNQ